MSCYYRVQTNETNERLVSFITACHVNYNKLCDVKFMISNKTDITFIFWSKLTKLASPKQDNISQNNEATAHIEECLILFGCICSA